MKRILVLLCLSIFAVLSLTACNGDDGENGIPGISGTDGKSPIIEVRDATSAECPTGGKVFITGFDNDSNGVVDVIINTSFECNDQEMKMSTSACLVCHSDYAYDLITSKHYDTYSGATSASCLPCHGKEDSFGEHANAISPSKTNGLNCLSCHNYNGKVKHNVVHTAYEVDSFTCGSATSGCHSGTYHNSGGHKYTDNASGKWEISSHGFMGNDNKTAMSSHATDGCKSCHVGSFFRTYSSRFASASASKNKAWTSLMGTKYGALYEAAFGAFAADGSVINNNEQGFNSLANRSVGCSTCHEPHSLDLRTKDLVANGTSAVKNFDPAQADNTPAKNTVIFSAEYLLCTSCHAATVEPRFVETNIFTAVLDEAAQKKGIDNISYHDGSATRSIADTHFAGKLASTATGNPIAINGGHVVDPAFIGAGGYVEVKGYSLNTAASNACSSCHDVHLTSKMGFFNKHSKTDNEVADANIDTYNMYKLTAEAVAVGHSGVTSMPAFLNPAGNVNSSCAICHDPARASALVTGKANITKATGIQYGWNSLGCATCHDMTMTIDNDTGVQIPRVTGIKMFGANTSGRTAQRDNYTYGWYITGATASADPVLPAIGDTTMTKEWTDKWNKSLLCITCHIGRSAPVLIGKKATDGSVITSTSAHGKAGAINVLGEYYRFDGKTYADASTTHAGASVKVASCTTCHGVSRDTHKFNAVEWNEAGTEGKILGSLTKADGTPNGCGCHADGIIDSDQATKAKAAQAGVTAFFNLFPTWSTAYSGDKTAIDYYGATANRGAIRRTGTAVHGGKLAKQIAWDSLVAIGIDPANPANISGKEADITAMKAWLGSSRP